MSHDPHAQLLSDIAAGARMHYGIDPAAEDRDLALLQGDQLYARGLAQLADLGDLTATAELADVISLIAQAQVEGDLDRAAAIWEAGAHAVRQGSTPALQDAKRLARAGNPHATVALRETLG